MQESGACMRGESYSGSMSGEIHQYDGTNKCAEYNKYRERRSGAANPLLVSRVRRNACK